MSGRDLLIIACVAAVTLALLATCGPRDLCRRQPDHIACKAQPWQDKPYDAPLGRPERAP